MATVGRRGNAVVAQALGERVVSGGRGRRRCHRGLCRGRRARRTRSGAADQCGGGGAQDCDANGSA